MATQYIIRYRNKREYQQSRKPEPVPTGTVLYYKYEKSLRNLTAGVGYRVLNHFCYFNELGWDEFVTLKNDAGYTVKMNLLNFYKAENN